MNAAFKAGRERFEVRQVDLPKMGPHDCRVKVHYCAICVWCYREWQRDGTDDIYGPGVTGHEMSGVVEQVGPAVHAWKPGDRVLTYFSGHCTKCLACRAGKTTYCRDEGRPKNVAGGYAEYVVAPEQCLLAVPDGMDLKIAGLISDMVGTSMHAIRRAFAVNLPRRVIAVWGLGPVGLCTVQGLRTFKAVERVIAIDPVRSRRRVALELGAHEALDPNEMGTTDRLQGANDGRGVDYAFNCALPSPEMAYETLRLGGYLMNLTGGYETKSQCEKRVDASFYFFKPEYDDNVRLVLDGKFRLDPIVTHEFPLDRINEAMKLRAECPEESLKVTIRCA